MATGRGKRPRVSADSLRSVLAASDMSVSALLNVLHAARAEDVAAVVGASSWDIQEATSSLFNTMRLAFELPLAGGGASVTWELIDPLLLLTRMVRENSELRRLFSAAVRRNPPSLQRPWRLAIACDAFTPGRLSIGRSSGTVRIVRLAMRDSGWLRYVSTPR